MRRFGKTSQNSLRRKHVGATARASRRVGAQRHGQRLAPRGMGGFSLHGRSQDPCPTWAGRILLLHHPQLLSACLPPSAFPKTLVTRIKNPIGIWATPRSAKPPLSRRRISTPRSQNVGFKMLGGDSNILDQGRERGMKDGQRFERAAREKELGEQSKASLYVGMKSDTDTLI